RLSRGWASVVTSEAPWVLGGRIRSRDTAPINELPCAGIMGAVRRLHVFPLRAPPASRDRRCIDRGPGGVVPPRYGGPSLRVHEAGLRQFRWRRQRHGGLLGGWGLRTRERVGVDVAVRGPRAWGPGGGARRHRRARAVARARRHHA